MGPSRQIPHCELVSETVLKIRCRGSSSVTRKDVSVVSSSCVELRGLSPGFFG
jgi:hypothetical protein